mgnify:CR=1 FL=1
MTMEEIKFNGYRLDVALKAQSPMIHFQADEPGATLRGSEVKPKLDRFLNGKISADNKQLDESAYINDKALNYKLSLQASGEGEVYSILDGGRNKFAIIYGDRNKKLLLRDATLTIICMNKELRKLIEDNIVEFFAVTNFGYMQNKGFGSFMPEEYVKQHANSTESLRQDMAKWLKATYGSEHCYYMVFSDIGLTNISDYDGYFKEIKDFYDLLKTGRNLSRNRKGYSKSYIYQYFHRYNFNNEKAWMKSNGIAPVLNPGSSRCAASTGQIKDINARYVKALLGIAPKLEYLNAENNPREKVLIKIDVNKESSTKENKPEIDRMESPIFFKIVGRHVFINAKLINENIYEREFDFNAELKRPKKIEQRSQELLINENDCKNGKLKVPSKGELGDDFTIDKLLSEYVRYYNGASPGESGIYLRAGEAGNGEIRDYALESSVLQDNKYVCKVEEAGNE